MIKCIQLLFALTLLLNVSHATNYYFSSVTGDDSRSSAEAQNPATPWKSLSKLNALNGLQPGDSILFRRGDVFSGVMNVRNSGVSGNVIYYGAYGTGANPVISGFTTLSNWTLHAAGIYYASLDMPNLNMVTLDGEAKAKGRYPNTGFLKYENNNGNLSITDNELPASPNWTGAEVVMRKYRFILDRHVVTNHAGTVLNYSTSTLNGNNNEFLPVKGNGYFIQGHLNTLDQFGEWHYDNNGKRLYVFFGSNAPTGYVVKASASDSNASVEGVHHITLENLAFEGGNAKGLHLSFTSNILVRNCTFSNQGGSALYGFKVSHVTVKGGTVHTSFSNGINFIQGADNCTVEGVSVTNSNVIAGTGRSGSGVGIGISVTGDNTKIINNRVVGAGYSGIQFLGNHVLVEKNYVDTFCTLKDDGGGIYTYLGASVITSINRKIRNNIVLNSIGAFAGAESYYYEAFGKAAGIYLDEHVNNVEVTGNTVANGDWGGIFLHNVHDNVISGNLIFNHRYQLLISQYDANGRNNTVTDNQYIARTASQYALKYRTFFVDNPSSLGTLNNNYYARPISDNTTIQMENLWPGGPGTSNISLAQWKTSYGQDAASQKSPLTYTSNIDANLRFEYNATDVDKTVNLDASYVDVKNNQYAGSISLAPFTGVVLLKSPTAFKLNQVITFPAISDKILGGLAFAPGATSTSGLPVSYRIVSGPATVVGNLVTLTGVGAVTIEATQAGDATYKPATAVTQTFSILAPNTQSITFPSIPGKVFGDAPFTLHATASSGLPVSYQVISGLATVSGNTISITGAAVSTIIVEATQTGNATFRAATPVRQSFTVIRGTQSITFPKPADKYYGNAPFALGATASSGLPVSYRVTSGNATVSGNMLTITGTGAVWLEASQNGDSNWIGAALVSQSFWVSTGGQTITFPPITNKSSSSAPFQLTATASSGLPITYRVKSGPATVLNNTVTLTGAAGEVWIEASQAGNVNYSPAPSISRNFLVSNTKLNQTITFPVIGGKTFGIPSFTISATASSGLPVNFRVVSGPATVLGNSVTLTGAGTVIIEASQPGNTAYNAAPAVSQQFFVSKANQAIAFPAIPAKSSSDGPFNLNATATSGLQVAYRIVSGPASVSGSTVTLTGATGTVTVEATQTGNTNYNAAPAVSQSFAVASGTTTKQNQTITFPAIADKTFGDASFTLNATASSGLAVSYSVASGPATVLGSTVTITGAGLVTIQASQAGNTSFHAAAPVSQSFTVSKASQVITFGPLANKAVGDAPFALAATASSGLPVTFSVVSGPATVSGNTVTLTGVGTVTIQASQPGNATYNAATPVQQRFTVASSPNTGTQSQAITFGTLAYKTYVSPPFALTATASSGLPVQYRVVSGPITISGNMVTINGVGSAIIEASQPGDATYKVATPVQRSFTIGKAAQTISFTIASTRTTSDAPFTLDATASSGLPVSYRIVSGPATVVGNLVTLTGATGWVSIEALQPGDSNFSAARPVSRGFSVVAGTPKQNQAITFAPLPNRTFGDVPFTLNATASSGLSVQYRVVSGPATVSGATVTITGAGLVSIEASQTGDATFNAAVPVSQSFTVDKASQVITFGPLANKTFGDPTFALSASASSGLPVLYRVVSGPANITGNTVTINGVGNVTIEAMQPGNDNFSAATPVSQSFTVESPTDVRQDQAITFAPLANKTFGDAPFAISATASSGLPVQFSVVSGPASVNGNTITLTGIGTVTIQASQPGDATYKAATPVAQSFNVASPPTTGKLNQTVTFGTLAYKNYVSPPFNLTATASSGLPVQYRVVSGPITISGNVVTITGVGSASIEASQPGDATYHAATPVQRSFTIGKASQTISFTAPSTKVFGEPSFALTATASSGLPVQYRVVSGPATVSGSTVTLTGVGTVTIEASQPGNQFYHAAYPLSRAFSVVAPTFVAPTTLQTASPENKASVTPQKTELQLTLYPNPVRKQGLVRVQAAKTTDGQLGIFDQNGRLVKALGNRRLEKDRPQLINVDVQGLPNGTYILRLSTKEGAVSQTFQVL